MNGTLWLRQTLAIARLELRRYIAARRWLGVYVLALAPVALFLLGALYAARRRAVTSPAEQRLLLENMAKVYAGYFQLFVLRFAVFVSCGTMFAQLFRGEVLEKTLHFYLLTPARRESLAAGKYLAALLTSSLLFSFSTGATFLLFYWPYRNWTILGEQPLVGAVTSYMSVAELACMAYGAVFLLLGLLFKNPAIAGGLLMGWEAFSFLLPSFIQRFSVSYYLQPLLPTVINRGPFAVVADATPPILGVPGLILFSIIVVVVAGWRARRLEITYGAD